MKQPGFIIEHCRQNCPKATREWRELLEDLPSNLEALNIDETLQKKFGQVNHHHLLKICLAGCANGCSRPDIKDFSISGYVTPLTTDAPCMACHACVRSCLENAITIEENGVVVIDKSKCLSCGNCLNVCPSGTLAAGESGWNLRLGGRMGRHPRFASFVKQAKTDKEVITWVMETIQDYINNGGPQERFTHFVEQKIQLSLEFESEKPARESRFEDFPYP